MESLKSVCILGRLGYFFLEVETTFIHSCLFLLFIILMSNKNGLRSYKLTAKHTLNLTT